jgi:hypothetical protein
VVKQPRRIKEVYPGLHDLATALDSHAIRPPDNTLEGARNIFWPIFGKMARALDFYMSDTNRNPLSVDARSAIRTALSTPSTFMFILIFQIFPELPSFSHQFVEDIYADFCNFVRNRNLKSRHLSIQIATTFSLRNLNDQLIRFQALKEQVQSIQQKIQSSGLFGRKAKRIYVYRLRKSGPETKSPALGKRIVIHQPDEMVNQIKFPPQEYHHLRSSSDNTIEPIGDEPQLHIIIQYNAPPDVEVIRQICALHKKKQDITKEEWFVGGAVFNLFKIFPDVLDLLSNGMEDNVKLRTAVVRGALRQGLGDMYGFGECRDQHGNVRPYQNLDKSLPENIKFSIDESASAILDICITVLSYIQEILTS